VAAVLASLLVTQVALAASEPQAPTTDLAAQARALALDAGQRANAAVPGARIVVTPGELDPRLHLAPCRHVDPFLPPASRPWGKTRVGLRCTDGPTHWRVYLPVTVQVFAPALVATGPLPAGTVLAASDLRVAEVDLAAAPGAALEQPAQAVGRSLARSLAVGDTVRDTDLKAREFFAAGETVRVVALGKGYSVSAEGQAMNAGLEGRSVRVRVDNSRLVTGVAVGDHRVELPL
jgi:flagella basal body P-ring formation protein FlgA